MLSKLFEMFGPESIYPIKWVLHYFKGSRKTLTLPEYYMKESRSEVLDVIARKVRFIVRQPNSQKASLKAYIGEASNWWNSAAGVVGSFNFRITQWGEEEGIHVECYDTFDFNLTLKDYETEEGIPIDQKILQNPLIKQFLLQMLNKYNIAFVEEGDEVYVSENSLAETFNQTHSFKTVWEHHYQWSELEVEGKEKVEPKWKGSYLGIK